ncbi:MAG: L-threonylcarbamoyladenylate synthase [Chitinophagales bacterium]
MKNIPDKQPSILEEVIKTLQGGETILYPTDTVWGLGCDATNSEAVQKIYGIKQRDESKALIILVKDLEMLQNYVEEIPAAVFEILTTAKRPTTIIYAQARNLAPNLIAADGSVAIRIPQHDFCQALFEEWQKPLVSTSANISGEPTPIYFKEVSEEIKNQVDYTVDSSRFDIQIPTQPSRILKIGRGGEVVIIRD